MTMHRSEIEQVAPLTPVQQGMLFHALHEPAEGVYVEQGVCDLEGPLDQQAFAQAWQRVVDRHAALRTAFFWQGFSQPLQVAYRTTPLTLVTADAIDEDVSAQATRVATVLARHRAELTSFDRPPLIRADLLRIGVERHRVLVSIHHLVHDAWSLQVIFQDLWSAYAMASRGCVDTSSPARPFAEFVQWQASHAASGAEAFWRARLAGLPSGRSWMTRAVASKELPDTRYGHVDVVFEESVTAALQSELALASLSVNSAIVGVWGILLARLGGCDDVVAGTVMLGRPSDLDGVGGMVGVFINTLPLRFAVDDSLETAAWLRRVQDGQLALLPYEHCALNDIRAWAGYPADRELFDTIVVCQQVFAPDADMAGELHVGRFETRGQPHYPLMLRTTPGSRLRLELVYDRHRIADTLAADVFAQARAAVRALADRSARTVAHLRELMATVDRDRVEGRRGSRRVPRRDAVPIPTGPVDQR
jgi:hypothetical protein